MRFLVIVCVSFTFLSMFAPSASAATAHGCAPSTPPPVSGTLASPPATYHLLFINEVLPAPGSVWNCSELGAQPANTPTNAWVEIYNPQNQAFDLYAAQANLDSGPGTGLFYFPLGSAIAAHGFLVVFPGTALTFYSTATATIRLLIAGTVIDQVTLPAQVPSDTSYARIADGGPVWQICEVPTIDASNIPPPTPTPTPKMKKHKPATHVKSSANKSVATDLKAAKGGSIVSGRQPQWSALQFPSSVSSSALPTPAPTATRISTPAPIRETADLPRKFLLTLLSTVLAVALLWCWRLFQAP